ncbi:MAG: C4-type zinc ribbon domain-containing protein [Treponemataceae bacterium]|nr:MAG: C4-type zinc ribbon domain-containing protein [Treponemataceae bacterium]
MITTDVFDKLRELQDILAEKYELEEKIEASPKLLSSQEELLSRLKKEFIGKNEEYNAVRESVNRLRQELQDAETARERGEKGMDAISTHREYEALDKEIKDAADREQKIRKELQREEKNLAEIKDSIEKDEKNIQYNETELGKGKGEIEKVVAELREKLAEFQAREKETNRSIDPDICFKFERIIKSKQGKGIVAVRGNVCDGCHMVLPAQFANKVRQGEEIVFCPYCSRILFYQELESGEAEYFQVEDTGSLADFSEDFGDEEFEEDDEDEAVDIEDDSSDMEFEE